MAKVVQELDPYESLLEAFSRLPNRIQRPPTFMEIGGYPHYENVCSNFLAFFFDPESPHGLRSLFFDALVDSGSISDPQGGIGGNVTVEREVTTDRGNRIDLLIESDTRAILIENKIFAVANNDFRDYAAYLGRRITDDRPKHLILLTIFPTSEGREWGFVNLTYRELVDATRSLLGNYVAAADTRYLTLLLDLLNTLENLNRGSRMNQEFVRLLADRRSDITSLFNDLKGFRVEIRQKVEELRSLVSTDHYQSVEEEGLWRGDTISMSDNLYYRIRVAEDLLVGVDANLSPQGWEIQIFAGGRGDPLKLRAELERLEIPCKESWRFIHSSSFEYDTDLSKISPVVQDVVDKLAGIRG